MSFLNEYRHLFQLRALQSLCFLQIQHRVELLNQHLFAHLILAPFSIKSSTSSLFPLIEAYIKASTSASVFK